LSEVSACATCNFPIPISKVGQRVPCPDCHSINQVITQEGVFSPIDWAGVAGLVVLFVACVYGLYRTGLGR
jgi:hypothetical protein